MKTLSLISLLLISVVSFAATKVVSKNGVFAIQYRTTEKNDVRVSILDNRNREIFSESFFNVSSFTRPYNFSQLTEGEYTIVIEDKNGKQVEKINYTLNKMSNYVRVSRVPNKENKFWLNVANSSTEQITVNIYNQEGVKLHEQRIEVTGTLSTVYDLSKVKNTKSVIFEVIDGNDTIHTTTF